MKNEHTWCVIMAGGVGSRFWPMSRSAYPKQFLDLLGSGRTLIQQTYDRFLPICPPQNILVVTNAQYAPIVKEQLPMLEEWQVLEEPHRRNTAPCVAYANHVISKRDPRAGVIVAASDHLVTKEHAFQEVLRLALLQARSADCIVTLGITPSRPDTGYGYIRSKDDDGTADPGVKAVIGFHEKPDHATAVRFMQSGDFLWNSGLFIATAESLHNAFARHLPDMEQRFAAGANVYGTSGEKAFIAETYAACESISIDHGVMEKAKNVFVVPGNLGWSDLGTWGSLYTHLSKDTRGNAAVGTTVQLHDCGNNVVYAQDDRALVLHGLEDFIVVSTPDALLVCRKQDEQKIKQFVADLTAGSGTRYV